MKLTSTLTFTLFFLLAAVTANAQVSGTVFRDFNGNGIKDNGVGFNEPFVSGVTVTATLANGTSFNATTDVAGAYAFSLAHVPAGTPVRIEFSGLGVEDFPGLKGTGNTTNVTFLTAPSATVSYAVNAPEDFWDNNTLPDPSMITVALRRGSPAGYYADQYSLLQINNNAAGPANPADRNVVTIDTSRRPSLFSQTGALFGLAAQKKQQRVFASALLRRSSGLGPQGSGGIYILDESAGNWTLSGSFTLQGVSPSNGGAALDFGSVTRVTAPASDDNYLSDLIKFSALDGSDTRDIDAFSKVGTIAYGDIEADPNSDKIYMVNLFQQRLIVFDAGAATATLDNAGAGTLAPFTTAYDITSLPGCPAPVGIGNNIRPYAIKIHKGKGYLGVISDGMGSQLKGDLKGYILEFDPNNIAAGFTTVVFINFNAYQFAHYNPWITTWAQAGGDATNPLPINHQQPMIAGIEFNEDGSMDISIRDRWGDQGGDYEFNAVSGATGHTQCATNGDLLHACWTGATWALEGTPGSCIQQIANGPGANNEVGNGYSFNNTGAEYYADRSGDLDVENNVGGVTKLMGSGNIISTVLDPINDSETPGTNYWNSFGIQWNSVSSGLKTQTARVIGEGNNSLSKANGMGDIEVLGQYQPIQIGNHIWSDADGDGIQDAGESGGVFSGLTVVLRSPGIDGIYDNGNDQTWTTTIDADGNYYFDNSNVGLGTFASPVDDRKPVLWTGVSGVLPGFDYRVEFTVPSGYLLTSADAGSNDNVDNDAILDGGGTIALATINTSNVNHNLDIGCIPASIGDKVWRDDDQDGEQDAGEPGVAGVTVTLYDNSNAVAGTTVTDAFGNYLFTNLASGDYKVGFTLPGNYTFTTQTNTLDNTDGSKPKASGSDADQTTGKTYTITLSAGESELNIDAGLIYTVPTPVVVATVGDRVWLDTNADGIQDAGEPGVSGVTVTLYNTGIPAATTITAADGSYLFTNVPAAPGYTIGFTLPPSLLFTLQDQGGDDNTDSDINPVIGSATYGKTAPFTVIAATANLSLDAGLVPQSPLTASIGDFVWEDLDRDGIQDPGEPGIPNILVLLLDNNGVPVLSGGNPVTTVTDAFGKYQFNNLSPASYILEFTEPAGYLFSAELQGGDVALDNNAKPPTGRVTFITVIAGDRISTIDAGMYNSLFPLGTTATLGDKVWRDDDGDGIQDAGEPGAAGISVILLDAAGTPVLVGGFPVTTTTDINGNYKFVNLVPGSYRVGFTNLPAGYTFTLNDQGGDDTVDSDVNPLTAITTVVVLSAGQNYADLDAGIKLDITAAGKGTIGNKVWYDLDNDGIQDAGELGVAGVTVTLKNPGLDLTPGTGDDITLATTTTNALGEYIFGGLDAGNYFLEFSTLPAGTVASPQDAGADDAVDSDGGVIGAGISSTGVYSLATGVDNLTIDLGLNIAGTNSLGDYVWFDSNFDGLQDVGEAGIPGVMVTLLDASGNPVDGDGVAAGVQPVITTTDINGQYLFAGLADGTYSVGFSNLPAGFSFTTQSITNTANGSDAHTGNGKTGTVVLNFALGGTDRDNSSLDAGLISARGAIGNFVWNDLDGDGIQDAGEPGVAGVTVTLYAADGTTVLASTITDQNGTYFFANLPTDDYVVGFGTIPNNIGFTIQDATAEGLGTDSDVDPLTGKTGVITLGAAELNLNIDAGIALPITGTIGDFVWIDTDADGIQDAGEPGVGGIAVTLYDAADNVIGSAVTDGNGAYLITNVPAGTGYYLIFSNRPGGIWSPQNVGGAGASDNSKPNASGRTNSFNVAVGESITNMDAGVLGWLNQAVLPVTLLNFTADKAGIIASLKWSTSQEINSSYISIQRSANGVSFADIGRVTAAGNSTLTRNYSFNDHLPFTGKNYYRLKLVSLDGKLQYSQTRMVRFDKNGKIEVYPNPVRAQLSITLSDNWLNKAMTITLYNQLGQTVFNKQLSNARQTETLDVTQLSGGAYILKLQQADNTVEYRKIQVID